MILSPYNATMRRKFSFCIPVRWMAFIFSSNSGVGLIFIMCDIKKGIMALAIPLAVAAIGVGIAGATQVLMHNNISSHDTRSHLAPASQLEVTAGVRTRNRLAPSETTRNRLATADQLEALQHSTPNEHHHAQTSIPVTQKAVEKLVEEHSPNGIGPTTQPKVHKNIVAEQIARPSATTKASRDTSSLFKLGVDNTDFERQYRFNVQEARFGRQRFLRESVTDPRMQVQHARFGINV